MIPIRVEWCDTDLAGIVYYANFFRYCEMAESELFRRLGTSKTGMTDEFNVLLPRVRAHCDYHAPARYNDLLELRFWVGRIGKRSIRYEFEFRREGRRIARGHLITACVSKESFRSVEIPEGLAAMLAPYCRAIARARRHR